ncbi:hypothetical protein OPIT5_04255 [Opitutaceae bacterium TAV5]|nr:hypothetical protein OPIT5_04255 [Opitutaceae bacterium TAV5]
MTLLPAAARANRPDHRLFPRRRPCLLARGAGLATLLAGFPFAMARAADAPRYTYTVLATPGTDSYGYSINNAGQIAGAAITDNETRAFLYSTADDTFLWLGSSVSSGESRAYGLNEAGQVAGAAWLSPGSEGYPALRETGFIHNPVGSGERTGTLGGQRSKVFAINASDHAVGWSETVPPPAAGQLGAPHAILYANGTLHDLGVLTGKTVSVAYGINDAGQVVGYSGTGIGAGERAFVYQNGVMTELGTLSADANATSSAHDINNQGQIVGHASTSGGNTHAFLYTDGAMQDLGTLSNQGDSFAHAINASGWIVGVSDQYQPQTFSTARRAFLYKDGQMYALNSLIDGFGVSDNVLFASDINSLSATGQVGKPINDWGQIVVGKRIAGQDRVLLLNPVDILQTTLAGGAAHNAKVIAGYDYRHVAPFTSIETLGTTATLLDGIAGANRDVDLGFSAAPSGRFVSDVLEVSGTGADIFMLQLTYDEALATALFGDESLAFLAWLDPLDDQWKNAVLGNSTSFMNFVAGAYDPETNFILGTYGIDTDTNTVWAVLDHNSRFAVTAAIPEPAALAALLGALAAALAALRGVSRIRNHKT